jgi:hypothetical protein
VPQTSIHALVVVGGMRGGRVDEEGLNELFDENGNIRRRVLDCVDAARCGGVLEGLGTWKRKLVLSICTVSVQMNLPIAPWLNEVNPNEAHCWPVGVVFQYLL